MTDTGYIGKLQLALRAAVLSVSIITKSTELTYSSILLEV
jgi:hypothetical protein